MHNKRDLQASIIALEMLYWVHRYRLGDVESSTADVSRLFSCSRSSASRIMDYAARAHPALYLEYAENLGVIRKYICGDVYMLIDTDSSSWSNVLVQAIRNQSRLGLSDVAIKRLSRAVDTSWRFENVDSEAVRDE